MNLIIPIEPQENFNVPEGNYSVELKNVLELHEPYKGQTEKSIKLKFRVLSLKKPGFEFVVGKRYAFSLTLGSELRRDLLSWLGEDGFGALIADGGIDLEDLIGRRGDVLVTNISNPGFANPFVHIQIIQPEGTLTSNGDSWVHAATNGFGQTPQRSR